MFEQGLIDQPYLCSNRDDIPASQSNTILPLQVGTHILCTSRKISNLFTFLDDYVFLDENESIEDEDVMVPNANSQFSQFPPNSNRNSRRLPRQRQRQRRIQKRDADLNTDYHVVYKRIQKDIQHSSDYGKFSRLDYLDFVKDSNTNQNRKNNTLSSPFFSDCIYLMSQK